MIRVGLTRLYRAIVGLVQGMAMVALVLLVVLVASSVVVRYFSFFGGTLHWTDEAARFTMIWLAMLGSVVALDRGAHLAAPMIPDSLSPAVKRSIACLSAVLSASFTIVLAWKGWELSLRTMGQHSPALGLRMGYVYAALPVGGAVLTLQFLALSTLGLARDTSQVDSTF